MCLVGINLATSPFIVATTAGNRLTHSEELVSSTSRASPERIYVQRAALRGFGSSVQRSHGRIRIRLCAGCTADMVGACVVSGFSSARSPSSFMSLMTAGHLCPNRQCFIMVSAAVTVPKHAIRVVKLTCNTAKCVPDKQVALKVGN